MKFGVLVFPGSNCDHDTHHVVDAIARQPVTYLWHASEDLQGCDATNRTRRFLPPARCFRAATPART